MRKTKGDCMSTTSLFLKLLNDLEQKITNETYVEGEKLPSERKLSEQYNISRNIVRQVLATLKEKGLIEVKPSRGAYVTLYDEEKLTESLKMIAGKYNTTIEDMLETREELEYITIRKAVHRRTDKDIEHLKRICEKMDEEIELTKFLEWDLKFHKALAEATQNKILTILVQSFYDLTEKFPFMVTKYTSNFLNVTEKAQHEHWQLIHALKIQDIQLATNIIKEHMVSFREELEFFKNKKML